MTEGEKASRFARTMLLISWPSSLYEYTLKDKSTRREWGEEVKLDSIGVNLPNPSKPEACEGDVVVIVGWIKPTINPVLLPVSLYHPILAVLEMLAVAVKAVLVAAKDKKQELNKIAQWKLSVSIVENSLPLTYCLQHVLPGCRVEPRRNSQKRYGVKTPRIDYFPLTVDLHLPGGP